MRPQQTQADQDPDGGHLLRVRRRRRAARVPSLPEGTEAASRYCVITRIRSARALFCANRGSERPPWLFGPIGHCRARSMPRAALHCAALRIPTLRFALTALDATGVPSRVPQYHSRAVGSVALPVSRAPPRLSEPKHKCAGAPPCLQAAMSARYRWTAKAKGGLSLS